MAQDLQDEFGADGVQFLFVLTGDDQGNPPDMEHVTEFADEFGLESVPVLQVTDKNWSYEFEMDGYIPTLYILDRDLRVVEADEGSDDPSDYL